MAAIETAHMPPNVAELPRDTRGYPVPWFVAWINGRPDFRVIDPQKYRRAIAGRRCWVCGERLTRYLAFTVGPMSAITRISSEPPAHRACAQFAAMFCPFLANPRMHRRDHALPDGIAPPPGSHDPGNSGTCLVWVALDYELFAAKGGQLIEMGEPVAVEWFTRGAPATRAEAAAALLAGRDKIAALAGDGDDEGLDELYQRAVRWLPQVAAA